MKKINKIILLLIIMLPFMVKADMAAPVAQYNVRVSNPNGAIIYEYDSGYRATEKKVDYDKICKVNYEYDEYITASCDDENKYYTLSVSDVSPLEINLSDYKHEQSLKYYVFDENVYLYEGPSKIYGKVKPKTTIPVETTIESNYYDEQWLYINYNGVSGWVYRYMIPKYADKDIGSTGLAYFSSAKVKTMKEVPMYKLPTSDEKNGTIIPKNVELNTLYYYSNSPSNDMFYVDYNGIKGWIKSELQQGNTINNHEGAIVNFAYYSKNIIKIASPIGVNLYENVEDVNSKVAVIPYGEELVSNYYLYVRHEKCWFEVEYDGKIGFITANGVNDLNIIKNNNETDENKLENPESDNVVPEDKEIKEYSSMKMTLIYIISSVILLSTTAAVTIVLINKKKKAKKNNVK